MPSKFIDGWDDLHESQQKLYELLVKRGSDEDLTLDDMRNEIGANSINTVVHHLKQLERKGYIRREGEYGRIEALSKPMHDIIYLNVRGTAGCSPRGFFNEDNVIEKIPFPAKQLRVRPDSFLVEARGDSMEPQIHEKDFVLIDRSQDQNIQKGAIALVVKDNEAQIKQVYRDRKQTILRSLNPKYPPIVVKTQDICIAGLVHGIVRNSPMMEI